jgi:hypothetical protein
MSENSSLNGNAASLAANNLANEKKHAPNKSDTAPPVLEKIRALRHRLPLAVRLPLAIIFLLIGIAAGFIPVLQGWIFVLTAFWLIFPDQAEQLIEKIKTKLEKFRKKS